MTAARLASSADIDSPSFRRKPEPILISLRSDEETKMDPGLHRDDGKTMGIASPG
jgi:hypothetical protein